MNYQHYDTLVAYLQDLIVTGPQTFNYIRFRWDDAGCLACHCRIVAGFGASDAKYEDIKRFLSCTEEEALGLFSMLSGGIFGKVQSAPIKGVPGIREALRRLAILATRYERPAEAQPAKADPMPASLRQTLDRLTRGETVTP